MSARAYGPVKINEKGEIMGVVNHLKKPVVISGMSIPKIKQKKEKAIHPHWKKVPLFNIEFPFKPTKIRYEQK